MAQYARTSAAEQRIAENAARDGRRHEHDGNEADPPMSIGDVAREFDLTLRALRFYEAKRLIAPQRLGTVRLYRRGDRARIALILTGRRLGFTLAEIRDLVGRPGGDGLDLSREQCLAQISLLERQKRGIDLAITELRQIYSAFYKRLIDGGEAQPRVSGSSLSP